MVASATPVCTKAIEKALRNLSFLRKTNSVLMDKVIDNGIDDTFGVCYNVSQVTRMTDFIFRSTMRHTIGIEMWSYEI